MKKQTLGMMISSLRKEKGMTQLELADKMGVTDKAVSKWERDLSFPDINSIPKLAEVFEVSVDELMQVKSETKDNIGKSKVEEIVDTAFKGIGLAMGIAVTVLYVLGVRNKFCFYFAWNWFSKRIHFFALQDIWRIHVRQHCCAKIVRRLLSGMESIMKDNRTQGEELK